MVDIDDSAFKGRITQTERDIVNKLSILEYVINNKSFRLYETSPTFRPSDAQSISDEGVRMLSHIGMPQYRPVITFLPEMDNAAGHIELNDTDSLEVNINIGPGHKGNSKEVLCILAHEICHKVLHVKKFQAFSRDQNEVFTDLAAIYCGFGKQILNGCYENTMAWQVNSSGAAQSVSRKQVIGYLSFKDYAFAYLLMCTFYGVSEQDYKSGLDLESLEVLSRVKLPKLTMADFNKAVHNKRKECAQMLRRFYLLDSKISAYKSKVKTMLQKLDYESDVKKDDATFAKPVTAYSLMLEPSFKEEKSDLNALVSSLDNVETDIRKHAQISCPYCQAAVKVPSGLRSEDYTTFKCFSCGKTFMVALTAAGHRRFWSTLLNWIGWKKH